MTKLIVTLDNAIIKEVPLSAETLTIGRKPHNGLQIENLAVSGEHAVIRKNATGFELEDLESTNGTLLNGAPLQGKHQLAMGDVVEIGKFRLKVASDIPAPAAAAGPADFEKTMIMRSPGAHAMPPAPSSPPPMANRPETAAPALGQIEVLSGSNAGKTLALSKNLVTFGKPGVQVAVISRSPQGYFLAHVEGREPPKVNGVSIGTLRHALQHGDNIELAGIQMRFTQAS